MKIDLIIGSLQSGGAERVVSTLANFLVQQGHDVSIITFGGPDKYELDQRIQRVKLHRKLPFFDSALTRGLLHLFKYYKTVGNRPDAISSHINRLGLVSIPVAKWFGIKVISSEHINHTTSKRTLLKFFLWNFLYRFADAITVLTSYDLPFFQRYNSNVVVMPNPNSFSKLSEQNTNREKTVMAIGSLDRYHHKGLDNLIDISVTLYEKFPDWKLRIIGEGEEGRKFLESKINSSNVGNFVILEGYRNDVKDLLGKSSIFVLSSRFEGLPMALIEAASQGIACIAYDCISGPSEVIENEVNGILVENQNHEEMANGILRLMADEDLRMRMGDMAMTSSEKYSVDKIGKKWEDLIFSIQ